MSLPVLPTTHRSPSPLRPAQSFLTARQLLPLLLVHCLLSGTHCCCCCCCYSSSSKSPQVSASHSHCRIREPGPGIAAFDAGGIAAKRRSSRRQWLRGARRQTCSVPKRKKPCVAWCVRGSGPEHIQTSSRRALHERARFEKKNKQRHIVIGEPKRSIALN